MPSGTQANSGVNSARQGPGAPQDAAAAAEQPEPVEQEPAMEQQGQGQQTQAWGNQGQQGPAMSGMRSMNAGQGGPLEGARTYPPCSRTVRDNCIQREGRRRR
jgi:hypothetical protein